MRSALTNSVLSCQCRARKGILYRLELLSCSLILRCTYWREMLYECLTNVLIQGWTTLCMLLFQPSKNTRLYRSVYNQTFWWVGSTGMLQLGWNQGLLHPCQPSVGEIVHLRTVRLKRVVLELKPLLWPGTCVVLCWLMYPHFFFL